MIFTNEEQIMEFRQSFFRSEIFQQKSLRTLETSPVTLYILFLLPNANTIWGKVKNIQQKL